MARLTQARLERETERAIERHQDRCEKCQSGDAGCPEIDEVARQTEAAFYDEADREREDDSDAWD